ncbi:hypothetical protein [Streptomyces abikoensis]|uniref:hypothetical protein n=1 Tax=Streptomyces abikoensis TaxID=97398 RepID=UPI00167C13CB|nr:hypothetical protein [Streptomyces abikoensis]GGP37979.1 hypothetical protein GCM10010214_08880 [Streptomyces abikoensis]
MKILISAGTTAATGVRVNGARAGEGLPDSPATGAYGVLIVPVAGDDRHGRGNPPLQGVTALAPVAVEERYGC